MIGKNLEVEPSSELNFQFELNKKCTTPITLTNNSNQYVAFKVKTTNPKIYAVRPILATISPGSCCVVQVTRQAEKEAPVGRLRDKFLIQTIVAKNGESFGEVTSDMFNEDSGSVVQESDKLRAVLVGANSPESEERSSQEASELESVGSLNCWRSLLNNACGFAGETDRVRNDQDGISQPQFRPEGNHTGIMENKHTWDLEIGSVCQDAKLEGMPRKQEEESSKLIRQYRIPLPLVSVISFFLGICVAACFD